MIVAHQNLGEVRAEANSADIALRVGCFDLLHAGHYEGLQFAREQADLLVVGVLPDETVERRKGPDRPQRPQQQRIESVDDIQTVDYSFIVPSSALGRGMVMLKLRPDVFVDHVEHEQSGRNQRRLLSFLGVQCLLDPGLKIDSTTDIINRMASTTGQ